MRLPIRETGSIRVSARKERVIEVLQEQMHGAVRGDRIEGPGNTYVVRESSDGTHVYHLREENAPVTVAMRDREALRQAVQADLFELRRVLDVSPR